MKYNNVINGQFVKRINRFIAEVSIHGVREHVHIKNTGRLKELLRPEAHVLLEKSNNPNRKTKYSLIAAKKNGHWTNIDSQAPNQVAFKALKEGKIKEFQNVHMIKREVTYGDSRFDLYFETNDKERFIEVKGVTLERNGVAMFPDAPTLRGTKHARDLIKATQEGYTAVVLFVVQMKGCHMFTPHQEMDKVFTEALLEAHRCGVHILAYDTIVKQDELIFDQPIPVQLFK